MEREPESRAGRDPARSDEPVVGRRRPTSDVPSVLQHAVEEAARLVGASGAVVCVLDPESGKLKYAHEAGTSRRHIHTLAEEIDAALHEKGDRRLSIAGYEASKWVVQDYGDVVIHVFDPDTRDYYRLEELWADAPKVDWERE